jgi:hypothetical protein
MKKNVLIGFLMFTANLLIIWFHLWLFKSPFPFAAWVTLFIHIILIIIFPYTKIFKTHEKI